MNSETESRRIVVAMTGASGALYGFRLLDVLTAAGVEVHLTYSPAAVQVVWEELQMELSLDRFDLSLLDRFRQAWNFQPVVTGAPPGTIHYHRGQDYRAGIASGSFRTSGMVVCPCSMGTLASLAQGLSMNLIHRAADVHLKERRKLVVVPRETPLSSIQLQNMKTLAEAGAVILPAMPGYYHRPTTIEELVDFIVTRVCDQLEVPLRLTPRWGT